MRGCTSPKRCQTALHFAGTAPADECSPPPEPVRTQQQSAQKLRTVKKKVKCSVMSVRVRLRDCNLDEGESGSRGEGLILVLNLVSQVLLHSLLLKHLLLALGPKQDPRGDGDGHCVLWLWLQRKRHERENGVMATETEEKGR